MLYKNRFAQQRVEFDPGNKDHIESYVHFMRTGKWGKVNFLCEWPYLDIPTTVERKILNHTLLQSKG